MRTTLTSVVQGVEIPHADAAKPHLGHLLNTDKRTDKRYYSL
jgi:hypothetical protein